jgi:phage shock protein A
MTEKLEVSVAKMEVQVQRLEDDVAEIKRDMKAVRTTMDNAGGAWKMLVIVGGFAAAVGSFVTKILTSVSTTKPPM